MPISSSTALAAQVSHPDIQQIDANGWTLPAPGTPRRSPVHASVGSAPEPQTSLSDMQSVIRPTTSRQNRQGGNDMSSVPRQADLTQVPPVPWAWVDEHVYAAIRGCSVKVLQKERRLNTGCPYRRINGTSIR